MIWANFLHFYQPPTQKKYWIDKITTESYRPLIQGLLRHPAAKVTLNINGVLDNLLDQHGHRDVLDGIRQLMERGQLELTGSAMYHPLLPMLPDDEIIRQIELNTATHRKYFGNNFNPRGFFPPEMAFSKHVAEVVAKLGYEWVIADELSCTGLHQNVDYGSIYTVKDLGDFAIYFRERAVSFRILSGQLGTGQLLINSLGDRLKRPEYLMTAMDGETFGHHRPGLELLLFEIADSKDMENVLISDLPAHFQKRTVIDPKPSTWALMEKDLERNKPFSRWLDDDNPIHQRQWELTRLAIEVVHRADAKDPSFPAARTLLDRALHSDQYWWASARPWWSLEMIERGAKELRDSIIAAPGATPGDRELAQDLYEKIIFTGFEWQREGIVEQLAHQEDEQIRQQTDQAIPQLPKKEIDAMVARLDKERVQLAKSQEYERAAQIRDRIKELRGYEIKEDGG